MFQEAENKVVKATIIASTSATDWNGSDFTLYIIKTETDTNDVHFLVRRYNQFFKLNDILIAAGLIPEGLMPGKKWLFNMDPNYIQERRLQLRSYIGRLLSDPSTSEHPDVQKFFTPQLPPKARQHGVAPSFDIEAPDPHYPMAGDGPSAGPTSSSSSYQAGDSLDTILADEPTSTPIVSSTVIRVDDGSTQFGWIHRSIWDPISISEMPNLLSQEISRVRGNILKLKEIKYLTERQEQELDAAVDQLKFLRSIVESKTI